MRHRNRTASPEAKRRSLRSRAAPVDFGRAKNLNALFRRKPLAAALILALNGGPAFAAGPAGSMIVTDGRTQTGLQVNGTTTNVTTSTIVGNNAFNSFSKFDVYSGNTVNLYIPPSAANLLNLINSSSASRIDGMLNAVKNGQIGGNVFLANPEGVIVGATGVINAGSLTLITPTRAFIDGFFDAPGAPNAAATASLLTGTVPINDKGLIHVKGRINTNGDATLQGGSVINAGAILSGAKFSGVQADFSDIVNVNDVTAGSRIAVRNGKIRILAANDIENSGTIASDGTNGVNANDIEIRAGHDINLAQGGLISASGHGEGSSGGNILVWANNQLTTHAGTAVRADGGGISGNGGFIDLSARKTLVLSGGALSATAPHGAAGSILLDPENLVVDNDLLRGDPGANSVGAGPDGIVWDAGNLTLSADDTITVTANHVISTRQVVVNSSQTARDAHIGNDSTGDSGNLSLSARYIVLNDGSQLLANATGAYHAGDITLTASDTATNVFFKALDGQDAGIEIHGATLKGRNIALNATANDVFEYTGNEIANVILKQLDNFAYIADVSISRAKAHVTIDQATTIAATGNVDISATANTEASMHVVSPNAIGFGYGEATSSAIAQVLDATITAGGHLNVTSDSTAKTEVEVGTTNSVDSNPLVPGSSKYIDLALAISQGDLTSHAIIGSQAVVSSGAGLSVKATGKKSANSTAEGMAYDDGTAGVALAFSSFTSDVKAAVDGKANTIGKVAITADLTTEGVNTVNAKSASGTGTVSGVTRHFDPYELLTDAVSSVQGKIMDALGIKQSSPTAGQKFGLAASFAYLNQQNNVEARIGDNAIVNAAGNFTTRGSIDVGATSEDILTYKTRSSVDKAVMDAESPATKTAKKAALSAAIAVVDLENHTSAYIGNGAVVDSEGAITVHAHSDIPVPYKAWGDWSDVTSFQKGAEKVFDLLSAGEFSLVTGWTQASAESDKLQLTGSFNFLSLDNTANAWIGDGARINTNNFAGVAQDVSVTALASQGTINIAGVFGFKFFGGQTDSGLGVGLGYLQMDFDDAAHASIGSGAVVNAHDLLVSARSETDNISIAEAGGKSASGTAINGSIAFVDVNNSTTAKIDGNATIYTFGNLDVHASDETRNVTVAGGFSKGSNAVGLSVAVSDIRRDTFAGFVDSGTTPAPGFSLAGLIAGAGGKFTLPAGTALVAGQALVYSKGTGAGISGLDDGATYYVYVPDPAHPNVIQLARSAADVRYGIPITALGGNGASGSGLAATGIVSSRSAIAVTAESSGMLDSVAVAGAFASDSTAPPASPGQSASDRMDKLAALDKQQRGRMGVAFSGDASVNTVSDITEASITGARIAQDFPNDVVSLEVGASNSSSVLAVAGAVAVSTAKGKVPGIAGSYSENDISDTTRAFLHDSTVAMDGALEISATSSGEIESWTVGVGISTKSAGVAGSVSINSIGNRTTAFIDGQSIIHSGAAAIGAHDEASIFALAGSLDFGGKDGFGLGASIAINDIGNTTDAHVAQSDLKVTGGDIAVTQQANQDIQAVAVSAGASTGGLAANFSISVNMIESIDTAYVSGKVAQGLGSDGAIAISASDESSIKAIGGGIAISTQSGGVGGSGAYSQIDNSVSAYLLDTKAGSTGGNVTVNALTHDEIETIGIGFAGGKAVGIAGSVAINRIDTTTDAYLKNADVTAHGSVAVVADADYDFTTYAGALGIGLNSVGFGGTVAVNLLYGDTHAYITGASLVDANGFATVAVPTLTNTGAGSRQATGVAVAARMTQESETWAISGGLSSEFGIGLTGSGTEATGETLAYVDGNSKVNTRETGVAATQGASIEAFTATKIASDLGGLGVGLGTAGIGATVGIALIDTTTKAYIDGAEVDAKGALSVDTYSTESLTGVGIAAGAGTDVGIAGTVFVTKISGSNEAYIRNANSIDVGGNLTVHAEDHVYLGKNGGSGILGGAAAVSLGASAGAAVSTVTISNETSAFISDSQTDAMGATRVQAVSSQEANSGVMGIAIGQWFGAAASVVVNNIATRTQAYIEETTTGTTKINDGTTNPTTAQIVEVSAANATTLDTQIFGAGGAFVGIGAGIDATSIRNTVTASIGANTEVNAAGDVNVGATSNRDVTSGVIAFGGGAVGVAGAVAVVSIGATMSASDVANTQSTVDGQTTMTHDLMGLPGDASEFSVASMFGSTVVPGGTSASIGSAAHVTAGGSIAVRAADTIKVHLIEGAGVAGLAGAGASVGLATLKPFVQAYVSDGATLKAGGDIVVFADARIADSSVDAYIGGVGGITLVQAVAKLDSDSTVEAYIGKSVKVTEADSVAVGATRSNEQEASAYGISVAATGAFGGSVAQSTSTGTTSALVDDNADLANAGGLSVNAANGFEGAYGNSTKSVAGAGGGLVGASGALATSRSSGEVIAATGVGVKLPTGDVIIAASRESSQHAEALGIAAGFLAVGVTISNADSSGSTHAELGGNAVTTSTRAGGLRITATAKDSNDADSVAGSGGVLAGNGAEANTSDNSHAFAGIAAASTGSQTLHTGTVTVQAIHATNYGGQANSVNAAAVGASGAFVHNDIDADAKVEIGANVDIVASRGILVRAHNDFLSTVSGDSASGAAGGVLVGSAALSRTHIGSTTDVTLDSGVKLESGTDPVLNPGGIVLEASTLVGATDHLTLNTGGAIAGAGTDSAIEAIVSNTVDIGTTDVLKSTGNIAAGTYTQATLNSVSLVNTWGLAGVGIAHARTTANVTENVALGAGASITGFGNVNLTAGDDPTGINDSGISANASAESYVRALVALPYSYADSDVTSNANLDIGANAKVLSAQNVTIGAYNGAIAARANGAGHGYQLGFIPTDTGNRGNSSPQPLTTAVVNVGSGAKVTAGIYHDLNIAITAADCPTGAVSCVATSNANAAPFSQNYIAQFNVPDFIDHNFSGASAALIKSGTSSTPVGVMALGTLFASGGTVTVNANALQGNGNITAYGGPSISVDNQSSSYLVLGNVLIPNTPGGRVRFTGAAGVTQAQAAGIAVSEVNKDVPGTVNIHNSFAGSAGNSTFGPALFLLGDIQNIGGTVNVTNDAGSLGQAATIFGKEVHVTVPQGVAVIELPDPQAYYAGGNPYSEWNGAMLWPGGNPATIGVPNANAAFAAVFGLGTGFGRPGASDVHYFIYGNCTGGDCYGTEVFQNSSASNGIVGYASADLSGSLRSSAIYGGRVLIKAKYIDINGGITIGANTDWSVNLDASLMTPVTINAFGQIGGGQIAIADYKYDNKLASNPIFELANVTASNGDSLIGVQYDAQNKRILLANVKASSDGGSLVLDGGIMSTNTLGRIHVNGGLGDVEVNNLTGRALLVQDIYTGSTGPTQTVASTVDITDRLAGNSGNHWVYQYTPQTGLLVFNGAAGSVVSEMTLKPGTSGYQPVQGLRWVWEQVATMHNTLPAVGNDAGDLGAWGNVLQCCNFSWEMPANQPNNPWQYVTDSGAKTTTPTGHTVIDTTSPYTFSQSLTATITQSYPFVQFGGSQNFAWKGTDFNNGTPTLFFPKEVQLTSVSSVKADNHIAIDFSGSSVGRVAIASNAPVMLGGTITNVGGATTINSGALTQSAGASIQTDGLIISGTAGIGTRVQPIVARLSADGAVTVLGGLDGVYLDLQGGKIAAVASKNVTGTQYGNVVIKSLDDLLPVAGGTGAIVGADITLTSTLGSIGSQAAPIRLSAMGSNGTSGVVEAMALHNIVLTDTATHDFLAGHIVSIGDGDISVSVPNGSILNAREQTSAEALGKDQIRQVWQDLHLTHDFGAEQEGSRTAHSVVAFQNLAERYYQDYFALIQSGDTGSARYQAVVDWLNQNVGGTWQTLPYNAAFHYIATDAQVAALTKNAVWTEAELSNSIKQAALHPGSGAPVGIGESNFIGHNVKLEAGDGLGKLANPIDIAIGDIVAGTLSDKQSAALTLANAAGDIVPLGKDALGNFVTYQLATLLDGSVDYNSVPAGVTPYGFRIAQTAPLFVEMTGALNAKAGDAAFLQSVKPMLVVDQVQAGGVVGLIAPESIVAAAIRTDATRPLILAGTDLRLTAGTGSLGSSAAPLTVAVEGRVLSASASSDAYLSSTGNLTFDSIFAGGQLALSADNGGLFAAADGVGIKAHGVVLHANGDIGSQQAPVTMQVADDDSFTGSAGGSANIHGAGATFNVASLTAGAAARLTSEGELQIGDVQANGSASVTAHGSILSRAGFTGVNITAKDITLSSDTGAIGNAIKRLTVEDHGTTNATAFGNLYLQQRNVDLHATELASLKGSVDVLVSGANATIAKISAPNAVNVLLTTGGRLMIDNLDPASANLAVSGAGGSIEVRKAQVSNSLSASASTVALDAVTQGPASGPLHLTLQGAAGGMADVVNARILSANGVVIDRLAAQNALIDANVANLWIENASIGSLGIFDNAFYTAYLDNVGKVRHGGDLQLYAPFSFYLRFFADPRFETNALPIDYGDNITVNGIGPENAATRFVPRLLALSMDEIPGDKVVQGVNVPANGLVSFSSESLIPDDAIVNIEQLQVNGR